MNLSMCSIVTITIFFIVEMLILLLFEISLFKKKVKNESWIRFIERMAIVFVVLIYEIITIKFLPNNNPLFDCLIVFSVLSILILLYRFIIRSDTVCNAFFILSLFARIVVPLLFVWIEIKCTDILIKYLDINISNLNFLIIIFLIFSLTIYIVFEFLLTPSIFNFKFKKACVLVNILSYLVFSYLCFSVQIVNKTENDMNGYIVVILSLVLNIALNVNTIFDYLVLPVFNDDFINNIHFCNESKTKAKKKKRRIRK